MLTEETIKQISAWVGRSYVDDGCWELVREAYATQGVVIPRSFHEASNLFTCVHRTGRVVTDFTPRAWDVVLIQLEGNPTGLLVDGEFIDHAGLCLGGRDFIHAMTGTGVSIDSINRRIWCPRIVGFMRYVNE